MKKERIWTSTFVLTLLLNFIFYLVFYLLTVIIGTVAMSQNHAPASIAGFLSGIFIVGGFIGRLWAGTNINRISVKRVLYGGTIFYIVMTLLYFPVHAIDFLLLVRFLHGIGFGISATAASTLAGHIVPISKRGEGIGYFALSITLASAFGPFLSIFLYHMFNYTILLIVSVIALLLALVDIFFLKLPIELTQPKKRVRQPFSLSNYFEKTALPISFIGFLVGIAYASILSFLAGFSAQNHLVTAGSLFYVMYALAILISRPITGRLFDLKGDNFVMYPTYIFFILSLLLTGFSTTSWMLLVAGAFMGLGYGSFSPFGQSIAIRYVDTERLGIATSTFFGLFDMGVGFGPFLLGFVLPVVGYQKIYYLAALLTLLTIVLYWWLHGRKVSGTKKKV